MCAWMLAAGLLSMRKRERGDKKQMKHFESTYKRSQESSQKVRGMLYAQIQDSAEKEYAPEIVKKNNCSEIFNPVFLIQNLLLAYL